VTAPVRAVLVDLDDTLYPQSDVLDAAWRAVADRGARHGLDRPLLLAALVAEAAGGSARGGILDRALERVGGSTEHVPDLLAAFRDAVPDRLTPYPGVSEALADLRSRVPIALVTDGDVDGQQRKVAALGLDAAFDVLVFSDRFGRAHRKPDPLPFRAALQELARGGPGVDAADAVMIGDRPDKDVAGAAGVGLRGVRVGTGEYADRPDHPATWFRADTFAEAVDLLLPHLKARRAPTLA
jgi:putative hydrolase of the HAD superfamily